MAAIHGRNGRLYADVSAAANGSAIEIPFIKSFSVDGPRDRADTTAFGSGSKTSVAGLPDHSGSADGFYNDASNDLYVLGDGNARKFYQYADATSAGTMAPISAGGKGYWYGTATFDVSTSASVDDAMKVTLNWSAASTITKI